MKIALCLYGYYNNKADNNAGDKGFAYIKDKVLRHSNAHEIDIFFHTWDVQNSSKIYSQYNPIIHEIEIQKDFNIVMSENDINQSKIDAGFNRPTSKYKTCAIDKSLSFFYSRTQALRMAFKHAKDNDFVYDCVIAARFDLGHRSTWHLGYHVSQMDFDPNLDMNYIYSAMWMQLNAGYADQWFFSNQENMELLANMYEDSLDYFKYGSEYQKAITNNWIDSDANNPTSNEFLKDKAIRKSTKSYPIWQMVNNHIIHKWHFIKTGLYEKSKFIGRKR